MDEEKTIAEIVAEENASDEELDEAKDRVEDAEDIDADEVMREDEQEEDETRGLLDAIMARLDALEASIDSRIDGLSRILIDGGGVIRGNGGGGDNLVLEPADDGLFVDFDDMDLDVDD